MRRNEKEITDNSAIEAIIKKALVCRLGLSEGHMPYIVPLCFGYKDNTLYFHGAIGGKKIDILNKNQNVCFEFDVDAEVVEKEKACSWGVKYQSVIGFGRASLIGNIHEKRDALDIILSQYTDQSYDFDDNFLQATAVVKVEIDKMTGKQSGF
ncbi:MAG: pyridoxamine 5'-phosphate oxidase family protein [Deltaproteobacteria bacterium]|nr:pyridoxamine 5'-phosphate oxidase family protein [Deltaproteobacteria bacterium]MBW2218754.1 pyridoxamine 5'-phosphate oxidase family protein [Deltaproteobacteria bacterium]